MQLLCERKFMEKSFAGYLISVKGNYEMKKNKIAPLEAII